ncbi:hypothetical protein SAMN05518801_1211, partial [Novosphingobium sp. CF614]|uniref:hypothetical protein n=1 Tax=Novosphingobium sp. CF614 TaxID=1884364 RepID=UPI0008E6E818
MVWRIGARVHALAHGLFKPSEAELVRQQWNDVAGLFRQAGLCDPSDRTRLIGTIADGVTERLGIPADHEQADVIAEFSERLFDYEGLFLLPEVDWSRERTIAELWDIREELTRQRGFVSDFDENRELLELACAAILDPLYVACPALLDEPDDTDGISVPTSLLHSISDLGTVTQAMQGVAFAEDIIERGLLARLNNRLERNLVAASGGNLADPRSFTRSLRMPEQCGRRSRAERRLRRGVMAGVTGPRDQAPEAEPP